MLKVESMPHVAKLAILSIGNFRHPKGAFIAMLEDAKTIIQFLVNRATNYRYLYQILSWQRIVAAQPMRLCESGYSVGEHFCVYFTFRPTLVV